LYNILTVENIVENTLRRTKRKKIEVGRREEVIYKKMRASFLGNSVSARENFEVS
jgi:hypothetical protein